MKSSNFNKADATAIALAVQDAAEKMDTDERKVGFVLVFFEYDTVGMKIKAAISNLDQLPLVAQVLNIAHRKVESGKIAAEVVYPKGTVIN